MRATQTIFSGKVGTATLCAASGQHAWWCGNTFDDGRRYTRALLFCERHEDKDNSGVNDCAMTTFLTTSVMAWFRQSNM